MKPQPAPAQAAETRTKQLEFSSLPSSRSQWKCTFTRENSSQKISAPAGPTTTAVCGPCIRGLRVRRGGRKVTSFGARSRLTS